MAKVSLSQLELTLAEVARHHLVMQTATYEFFALGTVVLMGNQSLAGYAGLPLDEVRSIVLAELDHSSALSVLSCVEAAIRTDYFRRVYAKEKSALSRALRQVYKEREERARLDADLLDCWRQHSDVPKVLIGDLIGAFNYRHWLAHGRYWTPKFGRTYDYQSVYSIADAFLNAISDGDDASDKAGPDQV